MAFTDLLMGVDGSIINMHIDLFRRYLTQVNFDRDFERVSSLHGRYISVGFGLAERYIVPIILKALALIDILLGLGSVVFGQFLVRAFSGFIVFVLVFAEHSVACEVLQGMPDAGLALRDPL